MNVYFNGNTVYCKHCDFSFAAIDPPIFEHPTLDEPWVNWTDKELKERLKICPNAGKSFYYPEMRELVER